MVLRYKQETNWIPPEKIRPEPAIKFKTINWSAKD